MSKYPPASSWPKAGEELAVRLERTTVNRRVLDNLERTWHRISPDTSYKMQSALGILKEIMGYHYEDQAVVAWDNSNLVGITVHETHDDRDFGTRDTHISELASFTHEPGIGKLLVEEVVKIAKEEGSDLVIVSHGPGTRPFYEGLGFVKDERYPEEKELLAYKVRVRQWT